MNLDQATINTMKQVIYQSVVDQEGNYYVAQCLNVDVSSFGDTEQEALANLQEALELFFEDTPKAEPSSSVKHPSIHTLRLQRA